MTWHMMHISAIVSMAARGEHASWATYILIHAVSMRLDSGAVFYENLLGTYGAYLAKDVRQQRTVGDIKPA